MLRVLWLIKSLNVGGAERLLEVLAARRDPEQIDVEVAFVSSARRALVPAIERHGVRVHDLGGSAGRNLRWIARLRTLVRDGNFDLVHSHSPLTGSVARIALPRTRHVYTEHNVWRIYHPATRALNAVTYRRNRHVIAVSSGVAGSIRTLGANGTLPPVTVVHHGYDDALTVTARDGRAAARAALGLTEDALVYGTVAIFRPQKRHDLLIDAFADLGSSPARQLVMIGGGPLEAETQAHARSRGLDDRVTFTGVRSDTQALLPALDVFVLSSTAEGLPVSLLEAMAAGIPVVSTSVGGIPEVVQDGVSGLLVDRDDPVALADALERCQDPELRKGLAAAATSAVADLSIGRAWEQILSIYRQAHGSAVPGGATEVERTSSMTV